VTQQNRPPANPARFILRNHGADPQAHQDQSMERLIAGAEKTFSMIDEGLGQFPRSAGVLR
jgi:hypothetical protein